MAKLTIMSKWSHQDKKADKQKSKARKERKQMAIELTRNFAHSAEEAYWEEDAYWPPSSPSADNTATPSSHTSSHPPGSGTQSPASTQGTMPRTTPEATAPEPPMPYHTRYPDPRTNVWHDCTCAKPWLDPTHYVYAATQPEHPNFPLTLENVWLHREEPADSTVRTVRPLEVDWNLWYSEPMASRKRFENLPLFGKLEYFVKIKIENSRRNLGIVIPHRSRQWYCDIVEQQRRRRFFDDNSQDPQVYWDHFVVSDYTGDLEFLDTDEDSLFDKLEGYVNTKIEGVRALLGIVVPHGSRQWAIDEWEKERRRSFFERNSRNEQAYWDRFVHNITYFGCYIDDLRHMNREEALAPMTH